MHLSTRLLPLTTIAATATMALSAGAAHAGILVSSATSCSAETLSQPFMPWLDNNQYTLVPGGNFEAGAPAWAFTGNAQTVSGNESYSVGGSGDSQSLSIPAGSSATSPSMCVGIQNPTLRFFARNSGSLLSTLTVSILWEDSLGTVHTTPIATTLGGSRWTPSSPIALVVNLLPLLGPDETAVAFKFTTQGNGNWQIDDTYVDPWARG